MYKSLSEIGIVFSEQEEELFNEYISEFINYNDKVNLISKNDVSLLFEKHIYDSLAFNLFVKKYNIKQNTKLLDIGTGGGFPALPLAMYYKKLNVNALDSIKKKLNFIVFISEKLNLNNIKTINSRIEDLSENMKNSYDLVTTRAMAELRVIMEYGIPFVKTGGYFIAYKSLKADEEIENAKNAFKILNCRLVDKIEYSLPIPSENKRYLLIIKKEKNIPSSYPRKNGQVKKKPL